MEAAPRYKLPTLSALLKLFTIQTAFHCLNSSMYACIYIVRKACETVSCDKPKKCVFASRQCQGTRIQCS